MAPSRPLMRGIRPPRVFATTRGAGGRASPYAVALAALLVASAFLLALIAFGVFSLPVSAPAIATSSGGETESGSAEGAVSGGSSHSHPARTRARRVLR